MLPKVKKEVLETTIGSFTLDNTKFFKDKLALIARDNPILFHILKATATREDWTANEKNSYILGAVQFYLLLLIQDECDELQEQFPLE